MKNPTTIIRDAIRARDPCRHRNGFSQRDLIMLIVVVAILVLVASILLPSPPHRGSARKMVCRSNLRGLSISSRIYSVENLEYWPVPAFDKTLEGKIDYRVPVGGGAGNPQSPNRLQASMSGIGGARQITVSRALWMLVRSGSMLPREFICPVSNDEEDLFNGMLDLYYDFASWKNLSYGYQVPYGAYDTRAWNRADKKMVLAADKGPYRDDTISVPPPGIKTILTTVGSKTWDKWIPYNSQNHVGDREFGQNVLFADGHAEFTVTPLAGIDGDNIYTIALDSWNEGGRVVGESPWLRASPPFSSTDSVIFP